MAVITPSQRLAQLAAEQRPVSVSMLESARQADRIRPSRGASPLEAPGAIGEGTAAPSFVDTLKASIEAINVQQVQADELAAHFAAGEVENVHDAMISMEKASLSFKFMVEVRNKLLEGYQELMRMQV
ncbi:MAG: flagellar hook-basal body complex protein FliE [bacterium]|jgi:flagellar hook-basal body complex protein FliE|nr:flagellar hook-basal body complex protein FliE [bacterium]